jgi:hypothetical protein
MNFFNLIKVIHVEKEEKIYPQRDLEVSSILSPLSCNLLNVPVIYTVSHLPSLILQRRLLQSVVQMWSRGIASLFMRRNALPPFPSKGQRADGQSSFYASL